MENVDNFETRRFFLGLLFCSCNGWQRSRNYIKGWVVTKRMKYIWWENFSKKLHTVLNVCTKFERKTPTPSVLKPENFEIDFPKPQLF